MSDQQFYVVGIHGPPTPKTAPHGVMYRTEKVRRWDYCSVPWEPGVTWNDHEEWVPLPPPPTEQAPAPEPEERWCFCLSDRGRRYVSLKGFDNPLPEECEAAADALNALDRDGVAWGPGRPMEELPGDPAGTRSVLVLYRGVETPEVRPARLIHLDRSNPERLCWWPLPGEATT